MKLSLLGMTVTLAMLAVNPLGAALRKGPSDVSAQATWIL
jgi:hypothetical protein